MENNSVSKKFSDDPYEQKKFEDIFKPITSVDEMVDWCYVYFDARIPSSLVYPTSTHSPAQAMFAVYDAMRTGKSEDISDAVMMASRDSLKTFCASALEVLCLIHFKIPIAHMAAIESQSHKAVQYTSKFFRKISPYLEGHGWKQTSDNKRMVEWTTDDGDTIYLKIVIATIAGANSEHVPMLFCVDGKTNILVKKNTTRPSEIKKGTKRECINKTARGIYCALERGETVEVLTLNHKTNSFEFKKVLKAFKTKKDIYRVSLSSGNYVDASEDHPFWVFGKEYVPLKDLSVGDRLAYIGKSRSTGLSTIEIEKIEKIKTGTVYDFTVEDNHNFFANGVLVHNCDEIDVIQDGKVLEEAKMIPSSYKNYHPLTVYLSTRKFAGGLMEKTIESVEKTKGLVMRWNIVDLTERITPEFAKINEPRVERYIYEDGGQLANISKKEWEELPDNAKVKYAKFDAYAGISEHPLLPIIKDYLVHRPQTDHGMPFKTLKNATKIYGKLPAQIASAQLLCDKPSSAGLVYPKFELTHNTMTPSQAYEKLIGDKKEDATIEDLREKLISLGATFVGGGDWGFTDYTSLVVFAMLPNGQAWLVDAFLQDKLEADEIAKYAKGLNEKWGVDKWYVDQNWPAHIKTMRRYGLNVPEFKKVVEDGLVAVQSRICDSLGKRFFHVIVQPNTQHIPDCFGSYSWAKDRKGDPIEGKPHHDDEYISDVMDSIRYPMQNLYNKKTGQSIFVSSAVQNPTVKPNVVKNTTEDRAPGGQLEKKIISQGIRDHIAKTTGAVIGNAVNTGKKKGKIFFSK